MRAEDDGMSLPEEVRVQFAGHEFGPPCSEAEIRRAEEALGERVPSALRELYLAFNGFLGPTDAVFFWPLFAHESGAGGLVEMNLFFRTEDIFPQELVSRCLFFGDNGIGHSWGLHRDRPGQVIKWDARWGNEFEIAGDTPLAAWLAEKRFYDEVAEQD
jgi:hypothetical protein